ncbi:hypothetical protein N7539_004926 [Penicillium diatomitis]|uniref:Proteasome assembly chaperone 3 n=1 Tax=Penicillium diatomitis TaxID=2819901 RepID=A0A9W9X5R0_9EURO|nr:uncharacterized protein N7539_004926 [Penicillium diatomitis]KAJ5484938.1 hypothetical protein N7539_004926 [Penicillium diatomitis]
MASTRGPWGEHLNLPFPAATKQVAGHVEGVKTDVMVVSFSDKIMLTVSQEGRLSHWPDGNINSGGYGAGQDTLGQLLARQIATAIAVKSPSEKRLLVVGLGLRNANLERDSFFAIIDLVLQCI